jgi:hypothetical protein
MTPDEINALPDRVRQYIHDIETRCDPTGEVQTIWSQREQIAGLVTKVRELEGVMEENERLLEALEWASDADPQLVEQIKARAALSPSEKQDAQG